jgi:PAS domain S-box-containing protein
MSQDGSRKALLSLSLANLDVGTLLPSTGIAAIFLDSDGRVKGFTPAVSEIWPLRSSHIGARLDDIPHQGVEMPPLPDMTFLSTRDSQIEHEVQTRDGRWYQRAVLPRESSDGRFEGAVVTFVDVTDRKRLETRLVIEHAVTRLLADADSFREVAREILQAVADGLHAEFAALWMLKRRPDRLSCFTMLPQEETASLKDFQRATRSGQYLAGEGLPGRVWSTRKSQWITDIAEYPDFPRAEAAMTSGLVSGAAFPILAGTRFVGVFELFTSHRMPLQPEWREMMEAVGCEIGEFANRRQIDERLRAEQARKTAILESSLDCIITMDHEGKIVDFNPAAVRTLGYAAGDVIGRPLAEVLIPERFRQPHREGLMNFLATGTGTVIGQRLELSALRADGTEIPVEVAISAVTTEDGSPFFTGFLRDISERKLEKRRQLRSQKIEYFLGKAGAELTASLDPEEVCARVTRLCVPGLADWAILDLLNEDGTASRVDVAFAESEKPRGESENALRALGQRIKDHPPRADVPADPPAAALFDSESVFAPDFSEDDLVRAAQNPEHEQLLRELKPNSFISVPLMARGATFGALTLIRANSARRYVPDDVKVVEELVHRAAIAIDNARLYRQAEQANRAKSDFLALMSHEIRTPMTAVLGYADILAARIKDPVCGEKISIIKRNGQFLLEIINDILDLSKIEAGRIELVHERMEVAELVGDVLSLMQLRATDKGLHLRLEYATEVPEYVVTDPVRLRQILINLIGNAIKFTEFGTVRLVVRFNARRWRLAFDVVDTGIGIPAELQQALFEPFNQGDTSHSRKYGGTGLGLTISRRLAQMLGGTIRVESVPGQGSTFTVDVDAGPASDDRPLIRPCIDAEDSFEHESPPRRLDCRVLVVDDREDIRLLAEHFVSDAGGRVVTTCDGWEAIGAVQAAQNEGDPYGIVLMDMQMPNLDGRETTRRLRRSGYRQPIIAITADAMQGDREKALIAGCDGYLSKPIDRNELISLMATCTQDLTLGELEARRHRAGQAGQMDADRWLAPPVKRSPEPPISHVLVMDDSPRVLIVDDWADTLTAMAEFLELAGFQTMSAQTGAAALDTYLDWQPAAVLMDLGLPDMDGCEALRRMRQCAPLRETYFVAITGQEDEKHRRRASRAGFHEYLVKPVKIQEIVTLLQQRLQPLAAGQPG